MARNIIMTALLMLAAGSAFGEQAQPASSLLDGLPGAEMPTGELTPAEIKINDGAPKLIVSQEVESGQRATRRFKEQEGIILLRDGQQLNGFMTLRAQSSEDGPFRLTLIEFRETLEQDKRPLPLAKVWDFAMHFTMADYKNSSDDPARSFAKGYLKLKNGLELKGNVALAKVPRAGAAQGGGSRTVYYAADATANIQEVRPADVAEMQQRRPDGEFLWTSHAGELVPVIVDGENFMLFRNPHPTTRSTGLAASMRQFGSEMLAEIAGRVATETAAETGMERSLASGNSLMQSSAEAAGSAREAAHETAAAFSDMDLRGFEPEYVIRNVHAGFEAIVTEDNIEEQLGPLVDACPSTAELGTRARKQALDFEEIEKLIRTLDACF